MSAGVVDSSVALAWCFEDEASPATDKLLERVRDDGAIVPALWYLELSNVLLQAERQDRITTGDIATRLELIAQLPIEVDHEMIGRAWREILMLARAEALTSYDAVYLDLAIRKGLPLLTRDKELASAARRLKVKVLP